jgi:hypothetical protein
LNVSAVQSSKVLVGIGEREFQVDAADIPPRGAWCGAPHAVLFWAAALIWFAGAWATADTLTTLLALSLSQGVSARDAAIAYCLGGAVGIAAGVFLFSRLARANVERIARLRSPRLWECFRPQFLAWLLFFDGGTVLLQFYVCKDGVSRLVMGAVNLVVCVGLSLSLLVILALWRGFAPLPHAPPAGALLAAADMVEEGGAGEALN